MRKKLTYFRKKERESKEEQARSSENAKVEATNHKETADSAMNEVTRWKACMKSTAIRLKHPG